eukprot:Pgem_evm1s11025
MFTKARSRALKFDAKSMMACERTYMNYVQFAVGISFFALGFLQIQSMKDQIRSLATAVVIFADFIILYSTMVFHLRRNHLIGVIRSREQEIPVFFNDWIGNLIMIL